MKLNNFYYNWDRLSFFRKISEVTKHIWYWIRTHTYNKYHLVDCRNSRNGYHWGWMDGDELLLFANMAILNKFVEEETAFECLTDWNNKDFPQLNKAGNEIKDIYRWWNVDRKREHDVYEKLLDRISASTFEHQENKGWNKIKGTGGESKPILSVSDEDFEKCRKMADDLETKDEEMLIRLIKIRGYLWT
jgi:hypothetical protein